MFSSSFLHEWRTAVRENRYTMLIPSAVIGLAAFSVAWDWSRHCQDTGYVGVPVFSVFQTLHWSVWPLAGVLVPYRILKRPDFHDIHAEWRTQPGGALAVFGSRLLLVLLSMCVVPAMLLTVILGICAPSTVGEQVAFCLRDQVAIGSIGFAAAFAGRSSRGLMWIIGAAVVVAVLNPLAKLLLESWVSRQPNATEFEHLKQAETPMLSLRFTALPMAVWGMRNLLSPGRPGRAWIWAGVFILMSLAPVLTPMVWQSGEVRMSGERLPTLKLNLSPVMKRGDSPNPRRIRFSPMVLAEAKQALSGVSPVMIRDAEMESGNWTAGGESHRIRSIFAATRPHLFMTFKANTHSAIPNAVVDRASAPVGGMLGIPNLKVWCGENYSKYGTNPGRWVVMDREFTNPRDVLWQFTVPPDLYRPSEWVGKSLKGSAEFGFIRQKPWRVLGTMKPGSSMVVSRDTMHVDILPWDSEVDALPVRTVYAGALYQPEGIGSVRTAPEASYFLLFNRKYGEGYFLTSSDQIRSDRMWTRNLGRPKGSPSLPSDWMQGAEIAVLSSEDDEPVILPVEFSCELPATKP